MFIIFDVTNKVYNMVLCFLSIWLPLPLTASEVKNYDPKQAQSDAIFIES